MIERRYRILHTYALVVYTHTHTHTDTDTHTHTHTQSSFQFPPVSQMIAELSKPTL